MVRTLVFTHRLDLALRLVDTTSGANIPGTGVEVLIDGKAAPFGEKGDHVLILQGLESRSFQLEVRSRAYLPARLGVELDRLPQGLPLVEVHLVPGPNYPGGVEFLTVEGRLPGIGELSAVPLGTNHCLIQEFDPRRRTVKVFNPHHLGLDRVHYGLVDPDREEFEPFRILHMVNDQTLKIDRVLETQFKNYFPIVPRVLGNTGPEGDYCLRVRDQGEQARWLVGWTENGRPRFRVIDFRETPSPRLEEGGE